MYSHLNTYLITFLNQKKDTVNIKLNNKMKEIKVSIHSFIDVITNSSTEIYISTTSGAESRMYELINAFLKEAGSEKTAEDLYIIKGSGEDLIISPKSDDSGKYDIDMGIEIYKLFDMDAEYNG